MSSKVWKKDGFDRFSSSRGSSVSLTESGMVASLCDNVVSYDLDGFVFSDQPIALDCDFTFKILDTRWYGPPISFGFTSVPPVEVVKMKSMKELYCSHQFWSISWNNVCANGEEHYFRESLKLMQLVQGSSVGIRVTREGEMLVSLDGVSLHTGCASVPTNALLWGWVNLESSVTSVQSQYQNGLVILRYLGRPYLSNSKRNRQYLCMLCKDLPTTARRARCCSKVCCRDCYKSGMVCQSCSVRVDLTTDSALEKQIFDLPVFCPNAGKGCSTLKSFPLSNVIHHRCKFQGLFHSLSGELQEKKQKISLDTVRTRLKHISRRKTSNDVCASPSTSDSSSQSAQPLSESSSLGDVQAQLLAPTEQFQLAVFDFTVPGVPLKDKTGVVWNSKILYTYHQGYKLSLGVNFGSNYFNYVSLYMYAGEYDDTLTWPFTATAKCELLRCDGSVYHTSLRYLSPDDGKKVAFNYTRRILLFNLYNEHEDFWTPSRFELVYKHCMETDKESLKFRLSLSDLPVTASIL